jgi:hypothetical protein
MTSSMILRRNDINVFHIFAAALCAFEITKLNSFAQGDGRYVLSAVFKDVQKRFYTWPIYFTNGLFFQIICTKPRHHTEQYS